MSSSDLIGLRVKLPKDENACPVVEFIDKPIEVDDGSLDYFMSTHNSSEELIKMAEYYMKVEGITDMTPIQLLRSAVPKTNETNFHFCGSGERDMGNIFHINYLEWVKKRFIDVLNDMEVDTEEIKNDEDLLSNITSIDDEQYDEWILQIHRLTPRKRKRWKSSLTDRHGRKSEVRWRYNKLQENHPDWGWTDIHSNSMIFDMEGDMKPRTLRGMFLKAHYIMSKEEGKKYPHSVLTKVMELCFGQTQEIIEGLEAQK